MNLPKDGPNGKEESREDNQNKQQIPEWMEKIANRSLTKKLALPIFPSLAIATCCLFTLITGNYRASLMVLFFALIGHVISVIVEEDGLMRIQDYADRADTETSVWLCKVCNNKPDICYLEEGDCFYVRCQTCGVQTEFGDTTEEVIGKWNAWKGKEKEENSQ